jgi:hypothetical protein
MKLYPQTCNCNTQGVLRIRHRDLTSPVAERIHSTGPLGLFELLSELVRESFLNKRRVTGEPPAFFKIAKIVAYSLSELDRYLAIYRRKSTSDRARNTSRARLSAAERDEISS